MSYILKTEIHWDLGFAVTIRFSKEFNHIFMTSTETNVFHKLKGNIYQMQNHFTG